MSDHTPGPWTWIDYPDGRKLLAAPTRAVIHAPDAPMTIDEADKALIASAPRLLSECDRLRALLKKLEWIGDGTNHGFDVCPVCKHYRMKGHAPDCGIKSALEESHD